MPEVQIDQQVAEYLTELWRLERAVIDAAKKWKQKRDDGDNEKWSVHYIEMCEAIDDLIDFEFQQIKK